MNVHFSGIKPDGLVYLGQAEAEKLDNVTIQTRDVLLNITGASIGRVTTAPESLSGARVNQHVCIIRPKPALLPSFLAHFLASPEEQARVMNVQVGATRQALTKAMIQNWDVPVAPFEEQRRIVAEIEKQFTRLDAGVGALTRVQANVKRYRAAVLKAACEGRLVPIESELPQQFKSEGLKLETGAQLLSRILNERRQHWQGRGKYREPAAPATIRLPPLPKGWTWASLDQICYKITDGTHHSPPNFTVGDFKYITSKNVREFRLLLDDITYVDRATHEEIYARCDVKLNDVLYVKDGANAGLAAKNILTEEFSLLSSVAVFRTVPQVNPDYLVACLNSKATRDRMLSQVAGIAITRLTLAKLKLAIVPIPPLAEQTRIVAEVERRLSIEEGVKDVVLANLQRSARLRKSVLRRAFAGRLVPQDPNEEPADKLLERIETHRERLAGTSPVSRKRTSTNKDKGAFPMKASQDVKSTLEAVLHQKSKARTASALFSAGRFDRDQVYAFYDAIADSSVALARLGAGRQELKLKHPGRRNSEKSRAPFRLHELWVQKFKNLENYLVHFDRRHALDVFLGWNGTGKSNLFEVLIAIFRDLHKWQSKDKWTPQDGLEGYRILYETDGQLVEIEWGIGLKRPEAKLNKKYNHHLAKHEFHRCKREEIPLPQFVFGYYSGPSNRFAELFSEPKQDHYERLLKQKSDDENTLAQLLEQRRFFNAETHHAKYALLSFFYEDDPGISHFLKKHLRIEGLESVLFVLKRPRWHRNSKPEDFWGADGLLRPVLERLRRHSIGQMVLSQRVDDGFQESNRDHYFLLLPNKESLQALASEYADPTSFFVALESADFSSIIHEVRIRVRISTTATKQTVVTFKEMSEGEQQLLMVLGLLRFTKMSQSLVLLDEPDTHLNPHWQLGYLQLLLEALVGDASDRNPSSRLPIEELEKRLTSQVLLSTHDPLAIAALLKENIHLLKRRDKTEECIAVAPDENPRGMGFTGILTSEMFGLRSDLDDETLTLLDKHAELAGKEKLTANDKEKLKVMTTEVERLGFKSASSDPYYRAYLQALARRRKAREILTKPTWNKEDINELSKETDKLLEEIEQEDFKK
jgi:restriction endonuclease S subunit/predicted ATPase